MIIGKNERLVPQFRTIITIEEYILYRRKNQPNSRVRFHNNLFVQ